MKMRQEKIHNKNTNTPETMTMRQRPPSCTDSVVGGVLFLLVTTTIGAVVCCCSAAASPSPPSPPSATASCCAFSNKNNKNNLGNKREFVSVSAFTHPAIHRDYKLVTFRKSPQRQRQRVGPGPQQPCFVQRRRQQQQRELKPSISHTLSGRQMMITPIQAESWGDSATAGVGMFHASSVYLDSISTTTTTTTAVAQQFSERIPIVSGILIDDFGSISATMSSSITTAGTSLLDDAVTSTYDSTAPSPILITVLAIVIGIAAQTLINTMASGEQGLGAYLRDGQGYGRSGFKPLSAKNDQERAVSGTDPLPWLKLPKLDFVEVAGQEQEQQEQQEQEQRNDDGSVLERLESLRFEMQSYVQQGKMQDAKKVQVELERLMKENGYDYET